MTGGKTRKDVAGYDLTSLLLGSEGTLAIATEVVLRILRKPDPAKGERPVYAEYAEGLDNDDDAWAFQRALLDYLGLPFDPERHEAVAQIYLQRGFLDFGRADPVAAGLDHRILAADEIEQALLVLPHPVAGPDGDAAGARGRSARTFRRAVGRYWC